MIKPDYTIITGANQFSDKYTFTKGTFSVDVIAENFIGTVTLQKSLTQGATWQDVDKFVSSIFTCARNSENNICYRICKKTSSACGEDEIDRDLNASLNIRNIGMNTLGHSEINACGDSSSEPSLKQEKECLEN